MSSPKTFVIHRDNLQAIADDTSRHCLDRVNALCDLYFLYQNDIHNQAKTVRQIQRITEQN